MYYYKTKDGKGYLQLKSPIEGEEYIEIAKEEFETLEIVLPVKEKTPKREKLEIQAWLSEHDWMVNKYILGEYNEDDEKWVQYLKDRKKKLKRYNELEKQDA